MKKLLSLPSNLVDCFHEMENVSINEYFCTSDPIGRKLGSGGGTCWLLKSCYEATDTTMDFYGWLAQEKRILLHAGGQSRRIPSYASSGKILTPIPFTSNEGGEPTNLLSLQLPLYENILRAAPASIHTLVASGDVYIRSGKLQTVPSADVVCYGLPVPDTLATNHGVFVVRKDKPLCLDYMLQKPSIESLREVSTTHNVLMDVGIWLLSDRAVEILMKRSCPNGETSYYDLYGEFGCALGEHPMI